MGDSHTLGSIRYLGLRGYAMGELTDILGAPIKSGLVKGSVTRAQLRTIATLTVYGKVRWVGIVCYFLQPIAIADWQM